MVFESFADVEELIVNVGKNFRHFGNRHRRSYARDDVFALRVHKEFAHKPLFAGGGVTRERDARAAIVAHIAERHHLNVDRSTPTVRDIVIHSVNIRPGVVPRTENRSDCFEELFFGVGREVFAERLFVFGFELFGEFFQVVRGKIHVEFNAFLFFHRVDKAFEFFFGNFHNDVREHLYKSAVAVPRPAGVARLCGKHFDDFFVEPEI